MSLQEYFRQYERSHVHPWNRICHAIGIPTIILSIGLLVFSNLTTLGWALFGIGWLFQFIGHAVERTLPEFMKNPVFLVIGPLYFADKVLKGLKSPSA